MKSSWMFAALLLFLCTPGRFLSLFYQAHLQSAAQIGVLLSVPTLVSIPTTPYLSHKADQASCRQNVLLPIHAVSVLCFLLSVFALLVPAEEQGHVRFVVLLVSAVLFRVCGSSGADYAIVTAISIDRLTELYGRHGHVRYGQVRLWGAVSWAVGSVLLGGLLDAFQTNHFVVFYASFVLTASVFFVVVWLSRSHQHEHEHEHEQVQVPLLLRDNHNHNHNHGANQSTDTTMAQAIGAVLSKDATTILFFHLVFWLGVASATVTSLLFLYFADDLQASNTLCGISVLITILFEIPLFALSPTLLHHSTPSTLMSLGALAYVVRAIAYSRIQNPVTALFLEPLHGVTYSLTHVASVAFVARRVPHPKQATAQSVLIVFSKIGMAVGMLVGGVVIQLWGARVLYQATAFFVAVATLPFVIASCSQEEEQ